MYWIERLSPGLRKFLLEQLLVADPEKRLRADGEISYLGLTAPLRKHVG
jgi:hypothetical protein